MYSSVINTILIHVLNWCMPTCLVERNYGVQFDPLSQEFHEYKKQEKRNSEIGHSRRHMEVSEDMIDIRAR